jgi:spermidine synthase
MGKIKNLYLGFGVFISGAVVMLIELLGTRIISPVFGAGIYVWSALISITLASLAIGYWLGGIIADKRPKLSTLYIILLCICISMIPAPFVSGKVMSYCSMLFGNIGGGLCSALLLFSPSLILLGMVPPLCIRLGATLVETIGVTSGKLYAISTIGSLFGTLVTGFILVPSFGNREILLSSAGFVLLFSGLGWVVCEKNLKAAFLIVIALLIPLTAKLAVKQEEKVIFSSQSLYGAVEVIDEHNERSLLIDGNINSHISTLPGVEPIQCEYVKKFELLPVFRPEGRSGLCVGIGGGLIPQLLAESNITFDVVDIDPIIPEVAKEYFGSLRNGEKVYITDGRNFIKTVDRQYDFIVIDPASVDSVPYHLYSKEFFKESAQKLLPKGIFAMNTMGTHDGGQFEIIQATLKEVFKYVRAFRAHTTQSYGNAIFFASNVPLKASSELEMKYKSDEVQFEKSELVLTDNYNPIDIMSASIGPAVRDFSF